MVSVSPHCIEDYFSGVQDPNRMGQPEHMEDLEDCGEYEGIPDYVTTVECEDTIMGRTVVIYLRDNEAEFTMTICEVAVYATGMPLLHQKHEKSV